MGERSYSSALDGAELAASRPCRSIPGGTALRTHCIECWVALVASLYVVATNRPALSVAAMPTELSQFIH
jgi:hypothetical protein